jgi:hypothetical protein
MDIGRVRRIIRDTSNRMGGGQPGRLEAVIGPVFWAVRYGCGWSRISKQPPRALIDLLNREQIPASEDVDVRLLQLVARELAAEGRLIPQQRDYATGWYREIAEKLRD